jgi:hypothetical protein
MESLMEYWLPDFFFQRRSIEEFEEHELRDLRQSQA